MDEMNTPSVSNETSTTDVKAEKFKEIATRRANEACKKIQLLTYLVGPNYHSTKEQRDQIIAVLRGQVDQLEEKFASVDIEPKKTDFIKL